MREINGNLVLFGGYNECFDGDLCQHKFYNEVYHYDIDNNKWYKPTIVPDPIHGVPEPRAYFGSCVDEKEDALVVYGGGSFPTKYINYTQWSENTHDYGDLWYYYPNYATHYGEWKKIETFGCQKPGNRSGSEIEIVDNKLYLVGGINSVTFTSVEDIWVLDILSKQWVQLGGKFNTLAPYGRYIFPLVKSRDKLYIFSGNIVPFGSLIGEQYQDLWEYDILTNGWNKLLPFNLTKNGAPNGFTGKVHGGMAIIRDKLVTFFGDDNDNINECEIDSISSGQSPVNSTWVFDLHPTINREWKKIDVVGEAPALKRIYYSNSKNHRKIFVYGGFNVKCDESRFNSTFTWNNDMLVLPWADVL